MKVVLEMQIDLLLAIGQSIVRALLCQLKLHKNGCYHVMIHTELDNKGSEVASWLVAMK